MRAAYLNAERLNNLPSSYARFLHQFPEPKLKNMQDAYLAGEDLAPYLESRLSETSPVTSSSKGSAVQTPPLSQAVVSLTTALCWSLAAPDILKPAGTTNIPNAASAANGFGQRSDIIIPGPLDNVLQGEGSDLVDWMKDWKGSAEHQEKIKTSISATPVEELTCSKHGISIIGHADFGLKRVGWSSTENPAILYDRPAPGYFRTLVVVNEGPLPVVLLDVCGVPSMDKIFRLHDDCRLAHHHQIEKTQSSVLDNSAGVIMRAGTQYQVTVELRCNQQDIAWHQQWLLFLFASGSTLDKEKQNIFVIGRRVSALIGHNIQDVQKCLSTEAKPFYPAYLRYLFDSKPLTFEVGQASGKSSMRDWRMQMPACYQTYLLSVWPGQVRQLEEVLCSKGLSSLCACSVTQLRQFSRLLALEEVAMERDIKEYDMFNVQLAFLEQDNFALEVPGLPENRPSVFVEDFVYIRSERNPQIECAAKVIAVEFQPRPRLILNIPRNFLRTCLTHPGPIYVHARFTFDRLVLMRMYAALLKVAMSSTKLLPCTCGKGAGGEAPDETLGPRRRQRNGMWPKASGASLKLPENLDLAELVNQFLNIEQRTAVENIANPDPGSGPFVILGPPGTGKTVTIVECVLQVLARHPSARLCVCAPSNYAADILCSGIAAGGVSPSVMWRMNDPRRTMASIKVDVLPFCNFQLLPERSDEILSFKVIVSTCGAAGMLSEDPLSQKVKTFTHIFIDEAGQALIPEVLIPWSLGNSDTCYVLCGDPKQLGPVVHSRSAAVNGLDETLIGRFQAFAEGSVELGGAASSVVKLVRNYRANSKLLELPSRLFYNNELIASAPASEIAPPQDWEEMKGRDFPMLFYGVKGQQMREGESPSYFNPVEAGKVVDLITGLISKTQITANEIGVMAPYRRQVQKLRLVLRSKKLGAVRVGTVDDYQGQEERVVFISTVLTRPDSLKQMKSTGNTRQIGFLSNAKRFNVAITRAKAMLVVVGHPLVLARDENWSELLRFCVARDVFRGYGSEFVVPALSPENSLSAYSEGADNTEIDQADEGEKNRLEVLETAKAIEKMAELSLLGVGDAERMYPGNLDSMYSAFSEDTEWRIQL